MEKLNLTKRYQTYFNAKTKPELVQIENAQFISIRGKGDPSDKPFAEKIEALYSVAYAIKFESKAKGKDFVVSKLEGLWWYDESKYANKSVAKAAADVPRNEWEYRLLIRMPDFIAKKHLDEAIKSVIARKKIELAGQIEYFTMQEGRSVQMLHVGAFSEEAKTIQQISAFMEVNKLTRHGAHHEIYLSDFRKTESSKLKTILRESVK